MRYRATKPGNEAIRVVGATFAAGLFMGVSSAVQAQCEGLPNFSALQGALTSVVGAGGNAGLGNNMWGTLVDRNGIVCAVARSGGNVGDQWPGSRVISAQKANTANSFSLPPGVRGTAIALSTANLYAATQPGGSLFGLQHSNPVDTAVAYQGDATSFGTEGDPLVGKKIGGVNVFGGGLALYNQQGQLIGALGVSGDTSCTDHIVAWKVRDALALDNIPGGVAPDKTDNIIFDNIGTNGQFQSQGGFGHPLCGFGEENIAPNLPTTNPIGPNQPPSGTQPPSGQ